MQYEQNYETIPESGKIIEVEAKIEILTAKVDKLLENNAKFDTLIAKVDKLTEFMMNLEKIISGTKIGCPQDEEVDEDYPELDAMKPAESVDELQALETLLSDTEYADKLLRSLKKKKSLDGEGDGKSITRYTVRLLVKPEACFAYTWKGQQRAGRQVQNQSFKSSFPKFIEFVNRVACAGDIKFALDKTHKVIESFLQNKHNLFYINSSKENIDITIKDV